ncbi:MAG: hypothetical protein PHE51_07990 [Eubacteriales bacterium]|nr:hypothetical protein [Eubacteriales bacterium]
MKKPIFYVCPECDGMLQGTGEFEVKCCGNQLEPLAVNKENSNHEIDVSIVEDDFYITINHEMTKEHYISFASYVGFDRVLTVNLYPEQDAVVRFPKMFRGKLYLYCNQHGLYEYTI